MFLILLIFFISILFSNNNFIIQKNNIYYKVQNGDSYSKIATKILVPYNEIIAINKKKKLYKDSLILLPNYFYYRIEKGDNFSKVIKKLNLSNKKNDSEIWQSFFSTYKNKKLFYHKKIKIPISFLLLKNNQKTKITQQKITKEISKKNPKKNLKKINITQTGERKLLQILQQLRQKEKKKENLFTKNKNPKTNITKSFYKNSTSPIKNYQSGAIIKKYQEDYNYNGLIINNKFKNIYSIAEGEIILADFVRGLKKTIIIRHSKNIFSIYGNLDFFFFKDKKVSKGQKIASGKKIYFAFFDNKFVDPLKKISF